MEVAWAIGFEEQRRRYAFKFTCEDCAHFDEISGECLHGFPNELHVERRYRVERPPTTIVFCKDFDLA